MQQKQSAILKQVARWVDDGVLKTTLNGLVASLLTQSLAAAHEFMLSGSGIGKCVLQVDSMAAL